MPVMEIGRVCLKKKGREAGKTAVVVDFEKSFALVDGPKIKRRKCSIMHLFPTNRTVKIKKNASHQEVVDALKELRV